jgi:PTS system mannose-specific IIA component
MRGRIEKALREADQGRGVLLLVDMFGGTPSNLCLSFLEERRVEVVTGVNLPMLVKVARVDEGMPLHEVAELARDYGRRNISVASDVLAGGEGSGGSP